MSKSRTQEEINRQIEGLKKEKETLPEYSRFGDNNWAKIDAQLDILEGIKNLHQFIFDENDEDFQEGDNELYDEAEKAENWLNGYEDEDLFS